MSTSSGTGRPRSRGERAGLDARQILAAARTLPRDRLSMQAVADVLGVDRKSLHHHVPGREALLALVAGASVEESLATLHVPDGLDWRETTRLVALGIYRAFVSADELIDYVRIGVAAGAEQLLPAEHLASALREAGFDDPTVMRAVYGVTSLAWLHARDAILQRRPGGHPQQPSVQALLESSTGRELSSLRAATRAGVDIYDEAEFQFVLDLVIAGLETHARR